MRVTRMPYGVVGERAWEGLREGEGAGAGGRDLQGPLQRRHGLERLEVDLPGVVRRWENVHHDKLLHDIPHTLL